MPPAILVIDDEAPVRLSLAMLLRIKGYEVALAANDRDGLAALAQRDFAAVLTDIMIGDAPGIETIATMRARHPGLRIIAMSGGGYLRGRDVFDLAREAGAHACIEKPFETRTLIALLEATLPRAR